MPAYTFTKLGTTKLGTMKLERNWGQSPVLKIGDCPYFTVPILLGDCPYFTPILLPTKADYQLAALIRVGIDPADWNPSAGFLNQEDIVRKVYDYYGAIFSLNGQFLWANNQGQSPISAIIRIIGNVKGAGRIGDEGCFMQDVNIAFM